MANANSVNFLKQNPLKRKLQETEFHNKLEIFFSSQSNEEEEVVALISYGLVEQCDNNKLKKYAELQDRDRTSQKSLWTTGYLEWSDEEFKERLRLNRINFEFILNCIRAMIVKQPTNMIPNPIEEHRQLALTIYRLAHGCSFNVLNDLFGVSQALATEFLNKVIKVMVHCLYDEFVKTPHTEEEWVNEGKFFMENYEFPGIRAWDEFHV